MKDFSSRYRWQNLSEVEKIERRGSGLYDSHPSCGDELDFAEIIKVFPELGCWGGWRFSAERNRQLAWADVAVLSRTFGAIATNTVIYSSTITDYSEAVDIIVEIKISRMNSWLDHNTCWLRKYVSIRSEYVGTSHLRNRNMITLLKVYRLTGRRSSSSNICSEHIVWDECEYRTCVPLDFNTRLRRS